MGTAALASQPDPGCGRHSRRLGGSSAAQRAAGAALICTAGGAVARENAGGAAAAGREVMAAAERKAAAASQVAARAAHPALQAENAQLHAPPLLRLIPRLNLSASMHSNLETRNAMAELQVGLPHGCISDWRSCRRMSGCQHIWVSGMSLMEP